MIEFIIIILAIWRVTSLLHAEDGPFHIFETVRKTVGKYTEAFDCFWCLSIWVAIPFAYFSENFIVYWLAYSAGAIIVNEVVDRLNNVQLQEKDEDNGELPELWE